MPLIPFRVRLDTKGDVKQFITLPKMNYCIIRRSLQKLGNCGTDTVVM